MKRSNVHNTFYTDYYDAPVFRLIAVSSVCMSSIERWTLETHQSWRLDEEQKVHSG